MRIKNKPKEELELMCPECKTEFCIDDKDERKHGVFGCAYVNCPNCGEQVYTDESDKAEKIKPNTLDYPRHFFQYGNGVKLENAVIKDWCREIYKKLIKSKDSDYLFKASGDTIVIGFRFKDEIVIYVAKDYEEFNLPLGDENNGRKC